MKLALRLAASAVVLAFVLVALSSVSRRGVCCADDGAYAMIAKNLAIGDGYVSTVQCMGPSYGVRPFDPDMGAGPTLIVPAAALIAVLGNRPWVPGLAVVLLWLFPLAAVILLLRRDFAKPRADLLIVSFALLLFLLFPYHFEQWYALLGEIPAASLALLAIVLWARRPGERRAWTAAGVLLGLAVLSKTLMLLWTGVFFLGAIVLGVRRDAEGRVRLPEWRSVAAFSLGFMASHLAFEAWKLVALGWSGYRRVSEGLLAYVFRQGVSHEIGASILTRMAKNLDAFSGRFGMPLAALVALCAASTWVVLRSTSGAARRLAALLFAGVFLHTTWWLFLSLGWPRYMVVALVPAALLVFLPILTVRRRPWLAAWCVVPLLLCIPTRERWGFPTQGGAQEGWFSPAPANRRSTEVARYLDEHAADRTVFTQWWAMVTALDYETRTRVRFQPLLAMASRDPGRDYYIVSDDRFKAEDPAFSAATGRCGAPVIDAPPYRLFHCDAER